MNKHLKMAIFVAPILIVLGYIAFDYYLEAQANTNKVFMLKVENGCHIFEGNCLLAAGDLKVNLFDKAGKTTINSTYALDSAHLFIVDKQNNMKPMVLTKAQSGYYWHADTPLRSNFESNSEAQKIRLIVKIKGGQYLAELDI